MALPQEFFDLLVKYKCGMIQDGNRLLIMSSKPLCLTEQNMIKYFLKSIDLPIVFETGPRNETFAALKGLEFKLSDQTHCKIKHSVSSPKENPTHAKISFTCVGKSEECEEIDSDAVWEDICSVMRNDEYFESWEFQDFFYNRTAAEALATNKCMDHPVTTEDVKDVNILVNAYNTVEEFLAHV